MAQEDVDPYLKPLFDLLGAGPSPMPAVPLPRRRPGTEPLTPEQRQEQNLSGSESMRQLGMKIDPVAWEKMLAESPDSLNIEDRRNETVTEKKARHKQMIRDLYGSILDKEALGKVDASIEEMYGPDNPTEVNPRGPQ